MKKQKLQAKSNIVIYQAKNGAIELETDITKETIWASQLQIANVFGVDLRTVNEHIKNIYRTKELLEKATIRKIRIVQKEGKREVEREVSHYNLDAIIAIGYRVNSKNATQFRIWATKVLKEHITKGFTINRTQIQKNYQEFLKAVESVQNLLPEHITLDPKTILELIKEFSSTWVSLDAYDKESLTPVGRNKKAIRLDSLELITAIQSLKSELIRKGEATEIFAQEQKNGNIEGIIGNIMQSFAGQDVYKTVEEKAAHLLYFMVKNHPLVDGNKRSGAFAFIWFLRKTKLKTARNISPHVLTALTLLIAESDPAKKDQMTALITQMLQ